MKTKFKLALAVLVGIALGATAFKGLNAQTKPPAYVVFDIEINDPAGYKPVADGTAATLAAYGGRFLIRGGRPDVLEGTPPSRFGIFVFDNIEKARAWYDSPATKEHTAIRARTSKSRFVFIIEGPTN